LRYFTARTFLPAALTGVAVLAIWQAASLAGLLPAASIPSMVNTVDELGHQVTDASFWVAVGETMRGWALGLAVAVVIAIPLGFLLGMIPALRQSCTVIVEFLKPIPPVALIPLALLLWGPSLRMELFLVAFGALWPIFTNVLYGVLAVDPLAIDMARSYRLSHTRTIRSIVVPSVLPFVTTGLRLAASIALIIAVVAELIGGSPGLGKAIIDAETGNALPEMYADIIVTGILGLAISALFSTIERPFLHWHASGRGA